MAKVRLLNDGGYDGLEAVRFPVVVYATAWPLVNDDVDGYDVHIDELLRIGADKGIDVSQNTNTLFWCVNTECELVEEQP